MRAALLVGAGALLWMAWRQSSASVADAAQDDVLDVVDHSIMQMASVTGAWWPDEPILGWVTDAEAQYGIPDGLLARLLYQESRYRDDIISGQTRSPAGALGIAQFMPATARDLGIDPLDPQAAVFGAGRYLRNLYSQTGAWDLALAAYNWGIGNVQRKGIAAAPAETRRYVSDILGDVPV